MSSYHRGRKCGPCFVCGQSQLRYDHFGSLTSSEQSYFSKHLDNSTIPMDSCICRPHTIEAKRFRSDPEHVPKWKKNVPRSEVKKCVYPDCTVTSLTDKIISTTGSTKELYAKALGTVTQKEIILCSNHYQCLYRQTHAAIPCAGCGAKPKARQNHYNRHSPDAATVSLYLTNKTGWDGIITQEDIICKSCYDIHSIILSDIENQTIPPSNQLQEDISLWKMTISDKNINELTIIILKTVIFVAEKLQNDKALLLPKVARFFRQNYLSQNYLDDMSDIILDIGEASVTFTHRWLMNQLIAHLQPYMKYQCVVKKLGTLIYPKNVDILKCLTLALHESESEEMLIIPPENQAENVPMLLTKSGTIINKLLHEDINKITKQPLDLESFSISKSINDFNPLLWNFVSQCTKSVKNSSKQSSDYNHTKTIRKLAIISLLLIATNPTCNTSFHHLIADTIEVCGGSRQLIKVLNKLGVCVSSDTHDRFVTYIAENQKKADLFSELPRHVFTIASADNIDFLSSHAAVYCGNQSRSYHGTTIQIVQPASSLCLTVPENVSSNCSSQSESTESHSELSLKRHRIESPSDSPHKLGKLGPKKKRTMTVSPLKEVVRTSLQAYQNTSSAFNRDLVLSQFLETDDEKSNNDRIFRDIFSYFMQKHFFKSTNYDNQALKPLREFLLPTIVQLNNHDPSKIYYMELLDENPDSFETMAFVAERVIEKLKNAVQKWVVLVGDGKTVVHLQKAQRVYGHELKNIVVFPGDWHILKNYQEVLIKAYYHTGLKEIAMTSGYRAETLNSLERCSNFKRTHHFLTQVWEAIYLEMIRAFTTVTSGMPLIQEEINSIIQEDLSPENHLLSVHSLLAEASTMQDFRKFIDDRSQSDSTWKLWSNFVFHDCSCYVNLFIAIRTSNWQLRMCSIKHMAPLFAAYDRPCYQRLIPNHIADVESYPPEIKRCFEAGGFTVRLTDSIGHAIALDEAHEVCINRDMKMAVSRPTIPYLKKTLYFFSYRIKAQKNLFSEFFPNSSEPKSVPTIFDSSTSVKHWDENVAQMRSAVYSSKMLPESIVKDRGLMNTFTGTIATSAQTTDLLDARKLGQLDYLNYITHHILQISSVANAPIRKRRLLTMAPSKSKKTRMSSKEREALEVNKYVRKRLAWCNQTGLTYDESEEQYSLLPRALSDVEGNPNKGNKSSWTGKLQSRYNLAETTPFTTVLKYAPKVVIIDAMFSININPLRQHQSIEQYTHLLLKQCILPHYTRGAQEVHMLFDHPERAPFNPKQCEHNRRYGEYINNNSKQHAHISTLTQHSPIPRPWREYLQCRLCKRAIVEVIGTIFLCISHLIPNGKDLIIAGCFSGDKQDNAWKISGGILIPECLTTTNSNAMEADMRIWRHASLSQFNHILIYCPDTDVYNIGLTIPQVNHVVIQTNLPQHPPKYIDIQKLLLCFEHDPDLASLPQSKLGTIMLQLYIVTGCDYISYFSGLGKPTFLNIFFQHAEFITGSNSVGCLSDFEFSAIDSGFLAFIRLIGTAYFKTHLATIISKLGAETPNQLFNSFIQDGISDDRERHKEWYNTIKRTIHVTSENQRPPSLTALYRHWMRSCWIMRMYNNSTKEDQYDGLVSPENHGWIMTSTGAYSIDWEAKEVIEKIQNTLEWFSKGCRCKTGCHTKRCACKKKEVSCGAGCECKGCINLPTVLSVQNEKSFESENFNYARVDNDEREEESEDESAEESELDIDDQSDEDRNEYQNEDTEFTDNEELETEIICDFIPDFFS